MIMYGIYIYNVGICNAYTVYSYCIYTYRSAGVVETGANVPDQERTKASRNPYAGASYMVRGKEYK